MKKKIKDLTDDVLMKRVKAMNGLLTLHEKEEKEWKRKTRQIRNGGRS